MFQTLKDRVLPARVTDGSMTIRQKEVLLAYALVLPSVLLVLVTLIYPLLYNIYLSFSEVPIDPDASTEFVGVQHYVELLSDPQFYEALVNTLLYTIVGNLGAVLMGLGVALLFTKDFRGDKIVRGIVLLPYIAPTIATAFSWQWILHPLYGIVPYVGSDVLGLLPQGVNLTRNLGAVILFSAWGGFPFAFLLILARLRSIEPDLYRAAKIDGAGTYARFKDITLPELKFVLATVFLLRFIWGFNVFAGVWLFTRDVPVLGTFIYVTGFNNFNQGLAAAVAVMMIIALFGFVGIYVKFVLEW
jgi:multiple sugar transport system permease protein